jgi:hypothetical protein
MVIVEVHFIRAWSKAGREKRCQTFVPVFDVLNEL